MNTIRIARKDPGEPIKVLTIENTLKSLQEQVGGWIEGISPDCEYPLTVFGNDCAKLQGLLPNLNHYGVDFISGPVVAMESDEEGELLSISEEGLKAFDAWVSANAFTQLEITLMITFRAFPERFARKTS